MTNETQPQAWQIIVQAAILPAAALAHEVDAMATANDKHAGPIALWAQLFGAELAERRCAKHADDRAMLAVADAMERAAREGGLAMREPHAGAPAHIDGNAPQRAVVLDLLARKGDVRAWAAQHWPELSQSRILAEPAREAAPAVEVAAIAGPGTAAPEWQEKARQIAQARWDKHKAMDVQDTLDSHAEHVAAELRRRGIAGPRGEWLSAGTIKREALQGAQWWRKRTLK